MHYFFSFFSLPPPPPPLPPFILLFCGPYYYYYYSLNIYTLIYASSWRPFQRLPVPDIYIYFIFVFIYLVLFLLPPKYLVFFPSYFSCLFFLSHHWNSFTKYEQICCCCLFLHYKKKKWKAESCRFQFSLVWWTRFFRARWLWLLTGFRVFRKSKLSSASALTFLVFFLIVGLIFFSFFFLLPFFFLLCVVYLMTWWRDGRGALCCYSFRLFFLSFFPQSTFSVFFCLFFISTYLNRNSNNISYDGAPFLDWSSSRERFNSRCSSSHVYLLSLHQVGIVLA